jgi:hypothetical protein
MNCWEPPSPQSSRHLNERKHSEDWHTSIDRERSRRMSQGREQTQNRCLYICSGRKCPWRTSQNRRRTQREGITHSRVHSSLDTSQDRPQTREKASLGQKCTRPFKDRGRKDRGVGREGVPEVVAERQGQNATNRHRQRTHPLPCSLSSLPTNLAPPPVHDQRSCLRRCAQRPQVSPSKTLRSRNARNAPNWRTPKSRGETHLRVSHSQIAENWDSEARSRLPTLERGRGSS